jgi:prepilin-type N-terminal cleavage/methylation domain-containing protein
MSSSLDAAMPLVRRREGFTLIELLTVVMIVGLLAAIALNRFWAVKERAYKAAAKNDLRTVAVQQERYFDRNFAYATTPAALPDFNESPGVVINIVWTASSGWAATAIHNSRPSEVCGYFTGPAPAGVAAPATQSGQIACDE